MPTNRTPIERPRQRQVLTPAVIALFAELEAASPHQRSSKAWKEGEHEIMRQLDLVSEYWTMCSVFDRSEQPCHSPGYIRNDHWHKVRAIRLQLLEGDRSCRYPRQSKPPPPARRRS